MTQNTLKERLFSFSKATEPSFRSGFTMPFYPAYKFTQSTSYDKHLMNLAKLQNDNMTARAAEQASNITRVCYLSVQLGDKQWRKNRAPVQCSMYMYGGERKRRWRRREWGLCGGGQRKEANLECQFWPCPHSPPLSPVRTTATTMKVIFIVKCKLSPVCLWFI